MLADVATCNMVRNLVNNVDYIAISSHTVTHWLPDSWLGRIQGYPEKFAGPGQNLTKHSRKRVNFKI